MRRQDRQRLALRLEEQRQQVVERRVLLARAGHPPLVAIAQRRLVAVMPVGDRHRRRGRRRDQGCGEIRRGTLAIGVHRPESMPDPVVVDDLDVGGARRDRRQSRRDVAVVASSNRTTTGTRVDAGRAKQLVAVLLGAGQRPLVGQHAALAERLQTESREEPALGPFDRRARAPGRSARRHRSTGAGPCAASRRSASGPASEPSGDSDRPARRRARRRGGPAGRRWRDVAPRGGSRVGGSITSYGGAVTSARSPTVAGSKRSARNGRTLGTGPRESGAGGTCPSYDTDGQTGHRRRPNGIREDPDGVQAAPGATFPGARTSLLRSIPRPSLGVFVRLRTPRRSLLAHRRRRDAARDRRSARCRAVGAGRQRGADDGGQGAP